MSVDIYKTIKGYAEGIFRDRGSRFLAYAFPVTELEEIKPILDQLRKEHHDARHHCFAYMLGNERAIFRSNDDGEPSGTGGRPILGQINSYGLTNILIVVVRYFGGTLLGVSRLINAYRSAAENAIQNSEIIECTLKEYYEIKYPYDSMNAVMKILKEEEISQTEQSFDSICSIKISVRASVKEKVLKRLERVQKLTYRYIETK
ncbi:MAG: YigZ family protein [Bacteroidales bacterium]|nr:YigZ family protein [Bacteroidales bacterium]